MTLFIILLVMGAGYSLMTRTSGTALYFELFAVWSTLALIGVALITDVAPALSLLIAAVVIAPLWYATLTISTECALSEAASTYDLWSRWRSNTGLGASAAGTAASGYRDESLATHLDRATNQQVTEEIELTATAEDLRERELSVAMSNLKLAPMEDTQRGRRRF